MLHDSCAGGRSPRIRLLTLRLARHGHGAQQHPIGPVGSPCHHVDAVVDAVAQIDLQPPRLAKQGCVAGGAAAMPVAGGLALAIRLRFHNHATQQLPSGVPLHQQAADEVGCDLLGGAGEESLRQWIHHKFEVLLATGSSRQQTEVLKCQNPGPPCTPPVSPSPPC